MVRTFSLDDGRQIPALAWGNGTGGLGKDPPSAVEPGKTALQLGIRHIDTAQLYKTEKQAGEAITASGVPREQVFLTTKLSSNSHTKTELEDIRRSVQESVQKLGSIPDLFMIHTPTVPQEGRLSEFWGYLEKLVEDGTLKGTALGVSNFRPQDLEEILKVAKIKPAVNQIEFHPYVLQHLEPLLELHRRHDIITAAYGPLTPVLRHEGGPLKPVLEDIAARMSKQTAKHVDSVSILLLWQYAKRSIAVTTSKNPINLKHMAEVESLPDLSPDDVDAIDRAGKKVHFRFYKEHMTRDFPEPDLPDH